MNTKFILFSELKEKDTFNENINMVVQDLTSQQGFTMESYVKLSENQIKNIISEGKILESVYDTVNEHHTLIWSGNVTGEVLKFKQYYFLKNELLYLLTLTTRPDSYEEYILIGDKILDSFKLK